MILNRMIASGLSTGSVVAGVAIGIPAGMAIQVMRRAWKDYLAVKRGLPGLRKTAWGSIARVVKWGMVMAATAVVLIAWLVAESNGKPLLPTSGVSHSSSPAVTTSHHR